MRPTFPATNVVVKPKGNHVHAVDVEVTMTLLIPTHRRPATPGEMLVEEFLRPLGITQTAFAARIGVTYPRLN